MIKKTYIPAKPRSSKLIGTSMSGGVAGSVSSSSAGSTDPNSHSHPNKRILDTITQEMLDNALREMLGVESTEEVTDENFFSALRTLKEILDNNEALKDLFLSKTNNDTAQGFIQFLKGISVEELATFLDGLTSEGLAKFNAGLESAFVLVENDATQGVVQGLTEADDAPVALKMTSSPVSKMIASPASEMITQAFTESVKSTSGAEMLGDLANVDESFDTVPDAVYSFRKQDGIFYPILGGGSTSARLTLTYVTPATATISLQMPFEIEYMFTSIIDGESTGSGSVTYRVNSRIVGGETIQQGTNVFDVKRHLIIGDNNVVVSVTDSYGNTRTLSFRITAVKVELTSTFNANQIFDGNIMFRFVPIGFGTMTIAISVDGSHHGEVVSTQSNRQLTYNIPKLSHGAHIIEAVMSIDSDGEIITSNKLEFSVISIEAGNNTAIIASTFTTAEATQFDTIVIPFTVYNPLSSNTDVEMIVNEEVIQSRVVDRTQQHWSINLTESGSTTLQIKAGSVSKFFYVEVAESNIADIEETEGLELKLISEGRNNAESNRDSWEYIDIKSSFNNFNWTSNGWAMDSNGSSYLKVSGNAKLEIPFKIFDTDFKLDGKTIEIQFFTEDVSNLDYVVLSCMQGGKGFEITSQKVTFKSEQSTITTQFKENELIKVSISVEQSAKNRLLSLFINGILSGVLQYPTSDNFIQSIPANIIAQGAEATIGIYTIRVYKTDLQPWQILNNYIFDYPVARERELIYMRNNILGAGGDISYARLVEQLPCLIITGDLSQHKEDKKTSEIEFEDRQNPERSFTATNVQTAVQGTSSQYYPRKNYKMKFKSGFNMSDGSHKDGFQTHEDTLPATVFTHKADFAESSGTHNTGLAKVMENLLRTLNIKTPPQLVNDKVRTTIDGFAIAIFHRQNPEDTPVFIGKYNFNTDKSAENTFGFDTPVECWEVQNNTSRRVLFKESDYEGDEWLKDFEGRFPEDNTNPVNLKRMTDWVVSCIGNPTKFRAEFSQYFHQDFMLSYWILTELFGMVDQRAKNVFWTTFDTKIWLPIFYDNDTVLGINNEGKNAFYFDIEIHDKIGTQDVWNGADSELWRLVEQAFPNELVAMYQRIRANNTLSYDSVLSILNGEHSDRWAETVYNEDGQFKYIDPLLVDGDGSYLYAAQGSRGEHRKWWLYNRFRYMDSKYNTGDFKSDYITMRLYTPSGSLAVEPNADFTVTTFGSQYIRAKWGSYETSQRVKLGEEITFESPDITFNDTETILYGASYLKTIGDLSGKYAGTLDISRGVQLTELIIGNSTPGYVNTNLHVLTAGNNKLLRKINIENCPNLTQAIDLSGCIGLEEVYAKGSGITGISLSQGGEVNILSLPATLINLTIIGHPIRITGLQLEGYGELSSLHIDKCPNLNSYTLVKDILSKPNTLQNIRLIDIDATDINLDTLMALASMRGIDDNGFIVANAVISGKIHIHTVDSYYLDIINTTFPFLVVSYDEIIHIPVRRISVIRGKDNSAVKEHLVTINGNPYYTDELGMVVLRTPDKLTVRVELEGHRTEEMVYDPVVADYTDYEIKMANFVTVSILIKSTEGDILEGASVLFNGETQETNIQGIAQFHELSSGTYTLSVTYGKTYSDNVTVGYNDLIHTYEGVVIPKRTIKFRHQTASSTFSNIADMEVYIDNVLYTTDSIGEVVYRGGESIVVKTTDVRYKAINQTLPTFTTDTKLDTINMHSLYTAEISVVGKNGFPLNGASVTLGSATALVISNIAHFPNTSYATGVNLKVAFDGETATETVSLGYTSYSKTVTLQVDEIESMKPVPNGNIQILAKAINTSRTEMVLDVRGWSGQNATIDWGDGSAPEVITSNTTRHTYPDLSYYNIEISNATNLTMADLQQISSAGGYYACVVAYWTIGNSAVGGIFSSRSAEQKINLAYLGDDVFINDTGRTDWSYLFFKANKLVNLPASFNKDVVASARNFSNCFNSCFSLTSIPEGLFDNCVNVTNFSNCFNGCSSLTSIPEGLFDNCVNVTNFSYCFNNCFSLTSIPAGLFGKCVNVTNFSYCFYWCNSLTSIPTGLFDSCVNVTTFNGCFRACNSLTSIPTGLFDNCVNVTGFTQCFYDCRSLVYCEIPMLKLDADKGNYLGNASYLTVLVSNSVTPPVITNNTIPNNTNLKIYVPDESVTAYKTATNWVAYESKIYPLSEYENN